MIKKSDSEKVRTGKMEAPWKNFLTAEETADVVDGYADAIEAGEVVDGEPVEEDRTPEQLQAEAETARKL
jgi:hypothetical protein